MREGDWATLSHVQEPTKVDVEAPKTCLKARQEAEIQHCMVPPSSRPFGPPNLTWQTLAFAHRREAKPASEPFAR